MNLIILAAGMGSRLKPLTDNVPKALVPVAGKPIFERTLLAASKLPFDNIVVVTGYRNEAFAEYPVTKVNNPRFDSTNMVESLFCASDFFNDEFVLSYGDIIYERSVLEQLIQFDGDIGIVIDRQWKKYWQERFDDPLSDAETLVTDKNNKILEIGKKPLDYTHIHGQYIGLMKFKKQGVALLKHAYLSAKQQDANTGMCFASGRSLSGLYMTDLLQGMIDKGDELTAVDINGGWLEVDSVKDKDIAESAILTGRIKL